MPDLAMCAGKEIVDGVERVCPRMKQCYRHTAEPTPKRQAYMALPLLSDDTCPQFLSVVVPTLLCKFCGSEFPPGKKAKTPAFSALGGHVYDKHRAEHDKIMEYAAARKAPANLKGYGGPRDHGNASLGGEYRRRMGDGTATPGADQRTRRDDTSD